MSKITVLQFLVRNCNTSMKKFEELCTEFGSILMPESKWVAVLNNFNYGR